MPRFFFHIRRGRATILDHEGVELISTEEATNEATRRALEIEANEPGNGVPPNDGAIVVDDDFSRVLEVPLTTLRNAYRPDPS